jgi:hypothetical protein
VFLITPQSSSLTIFAFQPRGAVHLHPASDQERLRTLRHPGTRGGIASTLGASPLSHYVYWFPQIDTPEKLASIVQAGHETYKHCFPILYLISIAFGSAAIIVLVFLKDFERYMNDHVARMLREINDGVLFHVRRWNELRIYYNVQVGISPLVTCRSPNTQLLISECWGNLQRRARKMIPMRNFPFFFYSFLSRLP